VVENVTVRRSTWSLLVDRNFGPYFWGNIASSLGMWAYSVAAVVLIFELTGSPLFVGLVTIVHFSVSLVLAPVGGALADRVDRRRLLIISQAGSAVAAAILAAALAWPGTSTTAAVWWLLVISFVMGVGIAVTDPARHALVPALVAPADLGQAIALNTVTFNVGRALGPALAGLLLVSSGAEVVMVLTAFTYAVFVVTLLVIRPRATDRHGGGGRGIAAGLRHVLDDHRKLALLLGVGVAGVASDPVITLTPVLAGELVGPSGGSFGIDSGELAVGLLAASFGVGAVLTMFPLHWLHRRFGCQRVGIAGLGLLGLMMGALAVAPNLAVAGSALFAAGVGYFLTITSLTTLLQLTIPEFLRGRVMALWGVCFLGSRPLAAFVDSYLAHLFSVRTALLTLAVGVAIATVFVARATRTLDEASIGHAA
jgi:MFS family permease